VLNEYDVCVGIAQSVKETVLAISYGRRSFPDNSRSSLFTTTSIKFPIQWEQETLTAG